MAYWITPGKGENPAFTSIATIAFATSHWLRLPERVDFTVPVTAFRVLRGIVLSQLVGVADLPGRRRLRSSSSQQYSTFRLSAGLLLVGARFLLQHPFSGAPCQWTFSLCPLYLFNFPSTAQGISFP